MIKHIRAPDSIAGEKFFQRHFTRGMSALVVSFKVSGEHDSCLRINEVEGLVAKGQLAAVLFHPSNSAAFTPSITGRLSFDRDLGPNFAFAAAVEAAKDLRERLAALGLVAFCGTTGGKGLHIVAPLRPQPNDGLG
jgi:bifunctional non-homologous end joining protein LigD